MRRKWQPLKEQWRSEWLNAISVWSPFIRLQEPIWCTSASHEKKEGLTQSFAMIRLSDHRVVISLRQVVDSGLEDYALEILAHEVGHHFQYPANLLDFGQMLARIKHVLGNHAQYAPLVLNLYTDLLINNRLFRQSNLRMDQVYLRLKDASNNDPVWNLYLRIYERLWQLPKGTLGNKIPLDMELESDIGARIIRIYAQDWKKGGARFALLFQRHFDNYNKENSIKVGSWMDIHGMDGGESVPDGLSQQEVDPDDFIHPLDDAELTGAIMSTSGDPENKGSGGGKSEYGDGSPDDRVVKPRSPAEYVKLLEDMGVRGNPKDWVVQYYREQARPYLIAFPGKPMPQTSDPLPESLDIWDGGSPVSRIDWMESLFRSPQIIPGVTTVERVYGVSTGGEPEVRPPDVYIGVDCSGSMGNPASKYSYPALAGTVILMSALRAGARGMVCLSGEYRGPGKFKETDGFIRDESILMRTLTDYLGTGSYYGPRHLERTFLTGEQKYRDTHVLVVSDSDLFTGVDSLPDGWEKMAQVAERCGSGATAVLNLGRYGNNRNNSYIQKFKDAGWNVAIVSSKKELVDFAREFSKKTYEE